VIGNAAYEHAPALANPRNDASARAAALRRLGFEVEEAVDLDKSGMEDALYRFSRLLENAKVGLFFHAGHALQVDGQNYMVPVDARLERQADLTFRAVELDDALDLLEQEADRTSLVFLDACRDNPFARSLARSMGTRSQAVGRGLAEVASGVGTLIAFATQPGNVAADGSAQHSPFTAALLEHIETPGLEIGRLLARVAGSVKDQTEGRQVPWRHSSLTGDFYFTPPAPEPPALDTMVWGAIKDSTNPEYFEAFIEEHPQSPLVPFACKRLAALLQAAVARAREPAALSKAAPDEPASQRTTPPAAPASGDEDQAATRAAPAAAEPPPASGTRPEGEEESQTAALPPPSQDVASARAAELTLGLSRDDWRQVQAALNALGHAAGVEDGLAGEQTRVALAAWQRDSGDQPTGYLTDDQRVRLPGDVRRILDEWEQAAAQGETWAQNNLGVMYADGRGVPQDDAQAVAWYRKAAARGYARAQHNLGVMYADGRGVPQDDAQ